MSKFGSPAILVGDVNPIVVIFVDALLEERQLAFSMHRANKVEKLLVVQGTIVQRLDISSAAIEVVGVDNTADCSVELGAAVTTAHDDGCAPSITYRLEDVGAEPTQIAHNIGVRVILQAEPLSSARGGQFF